MADIAKKTKNFVGVVVSDKMDKTVTVKVDRVYMHSMFGKTVRVSKKYKVHDEQEKHPWVILLLFMKANQSLKQNICI